MLLRRGYFVVIAVVGFFFASGEATAASSRHPWVNVIGSKDDTDRGLWCEEDGELCADAGAGFYGCGPGSGGKSHGGRRISGAKFCQLI
jgi:hypothetical protein